MQQKCHLPHLYLIGTVHLDARAEAAGLYGLLCQIRPQIILVEISPFSVAFRRANERKWLTQLYRLTKDWPKEKRRHGAIELLKLQLRMPFEWKIGRHYGQRHDIHVLPIDSNSLAKEELPLWRNELLTAQNLNYLVEQPHVELNTYLAGQYRLAQQLLCAQLGPQGQPGPKPMPSMEWMEEGFWRKREETLARRIKRIAKAGLLTVYIGGWMHLIRHSTHNTLINQLISLNPQALLAPREPERAGHLR
ncbi:MAG: hypothetical protein PHC35_02785 [Deltaproteobacteria bacterium]|nr:hypothetical protein [Deltaproteobacteria bacterium]